MTIKYVIDVNVVYLITNHDQLIKYPSNCWSQTASSGSTIFQNQCFLNKIDISSMGIPLVSGRNKKTNRVIRAVQPAKNRKIPYLKKHRRERKACAIMKVKRRFTATVILCPAERISNGNISLGTVHPSGPHDHPNARTNRESIITTDIE